MRRKLKKGVAYFDDLRGTGWVKKVNVKYLDMGDCKRCIVGQLEGDFFEFRSSMRWTWEKARKYGFCVAGDEAKPLGQVMRETTVLTAEWKAKILALRLERGYEQERDSNN